MQGADEKLKCILTLFGIIVKQYLTELFEMGQKCSGILTLSLLIHSGSCGSVSETQKNASLDVFVSPLALQLVSKTFLQGRSGCLLHSATVGSCGSLLVICSGNSSSHCLGYFFLRGTFKKEVSGINLDYALQSLDYAQQWRCKCIYLLFFLYIRDADFHLVYV